MDSSSSSSSSSDSSDIESGKRVKLKHDYKSEKENWKQAKVRTWSHIRVHFHQYYPFKNPYFNCFLLEDAY